MGLVVDAAGLLHLGRPIPSDHGDLGHVVAEERLELVVQDRSSTNGDQAGGQMIGDGTEPGASALGEDDGLDRFLGSGFFHGDDYARPNAGVCSTISLSPIQSDAISGVPLTKTSIGKIGAVSHLDGITTPSSCINTSAMFGKNGRKTKCCIRPLS